MSENKIIKEFPDYEISPEGFIYNGLTKKILKPSFYNSKYPMVTLRRRDENGNFTDATRQDLRYDILVANAFIPNPTNSTILIHKDKKLANCNINNLEWKVDQYYLYYKRYDGFRIYDSVTKEITTSNRLPYDESKVFYVTKPYEDSDESMLQYAVDFNRSVQELKENDICKFDYLFGYNHNIATMNFFKQTSKGLFEHHTKQLQIEYKWSKKCNNTAPIYCEKGTFECYGYDFSFNHGDIMANSDLEIPYEHGKEYYLDGLPDNTDDLPVGYYHVKIVSDYKYISKVFYFSKENIYTNIDLKFAMDNKKKFKFEIELFDDDEPNAYLYKKTEYTKDIFKNWFDTLTDLRAKFPKNILIKFMCSSLHGQLSSANTRHMTGQECKKLNLNMCYSNHATYKIVDYNIDSKDNEYYTLLLNEQPYKYNIRLQSFLMSACRLKTAKIVMYDIRNVVRIHTDNVTFKNVDPKFKIKGLKLEDKTTGLIEWANVNKGIKKTD
jgi:hypothetical protein